MREESRWREEKTEQEVYEEQDKEKKENVGLQIGSTYKIKENVGRMKRATVVLQLSHRS